MTLREFSVVGPTTVLILLCIVAGIFAVLRGLRGATADYWLAIFFFISSLDLIRRGSIRLSGGADLSGVRQAEDNSFLLRLFSDDMAYIVLLFILIISLALNLIAQKLHAKTNANQLDAGNERLDHDDNDNSTPA